MGIVSLMESLYVMFRISRIALLSWVCFCWTGTYFWDLNFLEVCISNVSFVLNYGLLQLHSRVLHVQGPHKLDWRPEQYRGKTGGSIPKILHHIFLDGEAEYNKCAQESL